MPTTGPTPSEVGVVFIVAMLVLAFGPVVMTLVID